MPNNCNLQYIFTYILQWINLIIGIAYIYSGACIGQQIRKVCRCQKGYRKSYIEEGQAMQWPNEKRQNDTVVYKKLYRKLKIEQHESHLKPDGTLSVTTWVFSFALYGSSRFCTIISQSDCTKYLNATKICRK